MNVLDVCPERKVKETESKRGDIWCVIEDGKESDVWESG